jgi:hypothetical protein
MMTDYRTLINPSHLSPEKKRLLWAGIKKVDPALAELLTVDPGLSALKNSFGASVRFTQKQIDAFILAGQTGQGGSHATN